MADYARHCADCAVRAACEHTFGAWWRVKSADAQGCNHPMTDAAAMRVNECLARRAAMEAAASPARKSNTATALERIRRMKRFA